MTTLRRFFHFPLNSECSSLNLCSGLSRLADVAIVYTSRRSIKFAHSEDIEEWLCALQHVNAPEKMKLFIC